VDVEPPAEDGLFEFLDVHETPEIASVAIISSRNSILEFMRFSVLHFEIPLGSQPVRTFAYHFANLDIPN